MARKLENVAEGVLVASYYWGLGTRSRAEGCQGWGGGLPWGGFLSSWRSARGCSWPTSDPGWHVATFLYLSALGLALILLDYEVVLFNHYEHSTKQLSDYLLSTTFVVRLGISASLCQHLDNVPHNQTSATT